MLLLKLRDYLKDKQAVSLTDVARHFDIPESATKGMLEHWVQKGYAKAETGVSCSGCSGCGTAKSKSGCAGVSMVYRWREGAR